MRVVVNCGRCEASVLILDQVPERNGQPDQVALGHIIRARGWQNAGDGAVCTDCHGRPGRPPMPAHVDNPEAPEHQTPAAKRKRKGGGQ